MHKNMLTPEKIKSSKYHQTNFKVDPQTGFPIFMFIFTLEMSPEQLKLITPQSHCSYILAEDKLYSLFKRCKCP
jgi:hypothetical protein